MEGKIDVGSFANAYHTILCEEYAKSQKLQGITADELAEAGLL